MKIKTYDQPCIIRNNLLEPIWVNYGKFFSFSEGQKEGIGITFFLNNDIYMGEY
jgi:hypothetical protein